MGQNIGNRIIGMSFILGALGCIASELGYFENFSITTIVLGIAFAGGAIGGIFCKSISQIVFCSGFCYYFVQGTVGFPKLSMWVILVSATLLTIGCSLVFGNNGKKSKKVKNKAYQWEENSDSAHEEVKAVFADTEKFIRSKALESVVAKSFFSSVKIYFDEANVKGNHATVHVAVAFGEVMLFVPRNWDVESNASVLFGDCNIRGRQGQFEKTLIIQGNVLFGDLEIIYI